MELAKHIGPVAVVAIQLCLPMAAEAGDDAPLATVVTVPVVDATEGAEITIPAPPSTLVLPDAQASGGLAADASPSAGPGQNGTSSPAVGNRSAIGLAGFDRRGDAPPRASSGRWLQIGKNSNPVRTRFRVNRSSAIVGLAVGF